MPGAGWGGGGRQGRIQDFLIGDIEGGEPTSEASYERSELRAKRA